jgi:hypothetical protein
VRPRAVFTFCLALVLPPLAAAQALKPDFSGTWNRDAARSEHYATADRLVITQSESEVHVRQLLCCRQAGEEWVITYYFDRWGPRAAAPRHTSPTLARRDDKPTQVRWDGNALVLHAGPELDIRGGSVRVWRLTPDGRDLLEEVVNRGLGLRFDFRAASIPSMFAHDRHVFTKAAAP